MTGKLDNGVIETLFKRNGRLNRWRYFKRNFLLSVATFIILMVLGFLNMDKDGNLTRTGDILFNVVLLVTLIPIFCWTVRRLHDIGSYEKLAYIDLALGVVSIFMADNTALATAEPKAVEYVLGFVNSAINIFCFFWPGTRGVNKYGPVPPDSSSTKGDGIAENFFRRDGRLNRWRYFKRLLVITFVMTVIITVNFIMDTNALGQLSHTGDTIFKVVSLASLIPIFCLTVRRLHDIGHDEKIAYIFVALSAVSILLTDSTTLAKPTIFQYVLGFATSVINLYCLFRPGTRGANKYGADPLA